MENKQLLTICEKAARAGGQVLLSWRGKFGTRAKGVADYVTDADVASQNAIREVILSEYPDHIFIGEEQPPEVFSTNNDTYTWIVDPLDGTTNYIHNFPCFAVSVAVCRGVRILSGVVYDPVADICFSALKGGGAWCNSTPIQTSAVTELNEALIAVSLPARVDRRSPDLLDFIEATQFSQGVRRTGSAALNLAHLASGVVDSFWAAHIHPWDVAAGVLLVEEAGGTVSGRDGKEFDLWKPHFIAAANPRLHRAVLERLTPFGHE